MNTLLEDYKTEYGYEMYILFAKTDEGDVYRFCSKFAYAHPHAKTGIPTLVLSNGKSLRELDPHETMNILSQLNRLKV